MRTTRRSSGISCGPACPPFNRGLDGFFDVVKSPIAVRSSSLLEDSHYQPFAGIYSTYMVPKIEEKYDMLRTVSDAIKAVYASVFYKDSKAYMTATSNLIDQEKMAIVLQEVVAPVIMIILSDDVGRGPFLEFLSDR